MKIILETKMMATEYFLIQGRNVDNPIVDIALSGDIKRFMKEELDERKKFGYPPFKIFIKSFSTFSES